jgi:WD40 repeat protein
MNRNRLWWVLLVAGLAAIATSVLLWNASYQYIPVYSAARPAPPGHNVASVAFSPDGKTLAVGGEHRTGPHADAKVWLWDVATRRVSSEFTVPNTGRVPGAERGKTIELTFQVQSVAFSPDGRTLAVGGGREKFWLWDVAGRRVTNAFTVPQDGRAESVMFSPDGKTLAVEGKGDVRLWDLTTRRNTVTITEPGDANGSVAFSPDGRTLAVERGEYMRLWDVGTRRNTVTIAAPDRHRFRSVAFSPDGRALATSGSDAKGDGEVRLWDVAARRSTAAVTSRHGHWVDSMVFSPDGGTLAIGGDQDVRLWDVVGHRYVAVVNTGDEGVSAVDAVAFSPDGRTVATGGYGIGLWREAGDD